MPQMSSHEELADAMLKSVRHEVSADDLLAAAGLIACFAVDQFPTVAKNEIAQEFAKAFMSSVKSFVDRDRQARH